MRCSRCEAENRAGLRFCEECGASLGPECRSCGAPMMPGKRFCGQCGALAEGALAPVHARAEHEELGEHKPVTLLFCDIVDSTATAERLGSEGMHRVLDRFFRVAVDEVGRYGGIIDKFLGDGLLAIVGVPQAHEDHARRAVLIAVGLRRRLRDDWPAEADCPAPRVRMGLNTGTVLVGRVGDGRRADYTVVGDTANVAARLQSLAQPGEILVSDATARLVGGYARMEAVGPVALRGRSSSVFVHRVIGAGPRRSPLDGVVPRSLTPFVGRDAQLAALLEIITGVREGRGQAVGIVAEPGLGKSRMLLELRRSVAQERLTFLEGRCLSFGAATPYLPVVDIVRANCGIAPDDPPGAVRAKAELALVEVGMDPDRWGPFLLHLLGDDEAIGRAGLTPEAVRAHAFETTKTMCLQGSRRRPLVVVVEDLHWIDPTSEALLLALAESLAGAAILLLTTYRPGYRPPWVDRSWATQLPLLPLRPAESRSVVRAAIPPEAANTPLEDAILARGEGNPFFLEELARAVAERRGQEASTDIPDTLHGVLMARIDRLADEPRRVLQTAAVLGREFSPLLLGAIWRGRGELDHHLAELRRLEFLYERPEVSEPRWVFKHALTQDVAYASLVSSRRTQLHEAAARALESLAGDRPDEVQELLAFHYARTDLHEEAVHHLRAAAVQSFRRHAHQEAAGALEEALRHAGQLPEPSADEPLVELTLHMADSLYFLGRFAESGQRLERVRQRVQGLANHRMSGRYDFAVALVHSHVGSSEDTVASARAAIAEAARSGDVQTEGRSEYVLCRAAFWTSRFRDCVEHGSRGASLLAAAGDRWWEAQCHLFASLAMIHAGDLEGALASISRGRAIGTAMGDLRLQSYAEWNLGMVEAARLNTEPAIAACTRSVELSPDPLNSAFASGTMGMALCEHGDAAGAVPWLERATETLYGFGVLHTGGWWEAYLAEARFRAGDLAGARTQALRALTTTLATGHRWATGVALRVLGRTAMAAGDLGEAQRRLTAAVETFATLGARLDLGITRLDLARCASREGRLGEVAALLQMARADLEGVSAPRWHERLDRLADELAASPPSGIR